MARNMHEASFHPPPAAPTGAGRPGSAWLTEARASPPPPESATPRTRRRRTRDAAVHSTGYDNHAAHPSCGSVVTLRRGALTPSLTGVHPSGAPSLSRRSADSAILAREETDRIGC